MVVLGFEAVVHDRAATPEEIGFGPGKTIAELSQRAHQGFVAGIDPSETMLHQARRRNAAALQRGRVDLRCGSISRIPFGDGAFHKVLTINTLFFWPEPESDLREVRRVLEEEGKLVICFRKKEPSAAGRQVDDPRALWGTSIGQVEEVLDMAGFRNIRRTVRDDPTIAWNLTTSSGSYGSESVGVCATA